MTLPTRKMITGRELMASLLALGSLACGGGRTALLTLGAGSGNGGTGGIPGAGLHPGGGAAGGAGGSTASDAKSFTSAQVAAALASCDLPHGPALNIDIPNDEKARLVGAWLLCPTSADAGPPTLFDPGIKLEADGTFERLTADGSGGLATATGVRNQGQWSAFCEASSDLKPSQSCGNFGDWGVLISIHVMAGDESPTGCFVGPMSFESSPTRIYVVDHLNWYCSGNEPEVTLDFWMVPIL